MAATFQHAAFEQFNPLRRPDWRHLRVLELVDRFQTPGRCSPRDDPWVKRFRNFLVRHRYLQTQDSDALRAGQGRRLYQENPDLYYANELHTSRHHKRLATCLQARLLARQDDWEIAEQLATLPQTIAAYEALFFNIRDRIDAHDWVISQILVPAHALMRGDAYSHELEDMSLKFFGYFGGPLVLDFVISGFRRGLRVTDPEKLGEYFDQHFALTLKRRSASLISWFEVNRYQIMELFATHTRLMEIERSEEAAQTLKTSYEKNLQVMMGEMLWTVGKQGPERMLDTPLARYDHGAAELRDQEVMELQLTGAVPALPDYSIPPPHNTGLKPPPEDL